MHKFNLVLHPSWLSFNFTYGLSFAHCLGFAWHKLAFYIFCVMTKQITCCMQNIKCILLNSHWFHYIHKLKNAQSQTKHYNIMIVFDSIYIWSLNVNIVLKYLNVESNSYHLFWKIVDNWLKVRNLETKFNCKLKIGRYGLSEWRNVWII